MRSWWTEQPDNDDIKRKLANSYNNLGTIERAEGHPDKAVPWYSKANDIRAQARRQGGKNELFRRDLAGGLLQRGRGAARGRQAGRRGRELSRSRSSFTRSLADEFPLVIEYRRELGMCHKTLGDLRSHTDRFQDAQECYERAREIQQPLAHDNPVLVELAADLAGTFMGLGDLKNLQGEAAEALRLHEEAGAILRQLVRDNPTVYAISAGPGRAAVALGHDAVRRRRERQVARHASRSALNGYARLLNADEDNRAVRKTAWLVRIRTWEW